VTVFFADIRGFTTYTDQQDLRATREIEELKLTEEAATACRNRYAAESLKTVNLYLATIVDAVMKHGGTLDKYIGDCVMAFWGAPLADTKHAANAVRAAVDAQRQVQSLNSQRQQIGAHITANNHFNGDRSEAAPSALPMLTLGIAIHTGEMIVGFMGSERHLSNYTVFGKNVNIASRIEKLADGGRIVTTKATFDAVQASDAELAKAFTARDKVDVKGIIEPLALFDVRS
jgi:adenylate cyclase